MVLGGAGLFDKYCWWLKLFVNPAPTTSNIVSGCIDIVNNGTRKTRGIGELGKEINCNHIAEKISSILNN